MSNFQEVNRKQAFNGLVQEVILETSKQYIDVESYLDEMMEYLQPQKDKMIQANGRGILIGEVDKVRSCTQLMKTVDYDDEDNWFSWHDDADHDDDEIQVNLHSGKLQIQNRD